MQKPIRMTAYDRKSGGFRGGFRVPSASLKLKVTWKIVIHAIALRLHPRRALRACRIWGAFIVVSRLGVRTSLTP